MSVKLTFQNDRIEIVDEPMYTVGSADNKRRYTTEVDLTATKDYCSCHGVVINGGPVVVFCAGAGATGIHENSALLLEGDLYLAVGDQVICFDLSNRHLRWTLQIDHATCFGVYYRAENDALISHGELEISRFTRDGKILWRFSAADIFSEKIELKDDCVNAVDFDGNIYNLDYDSGEELS